MTIIKDPEVAAAAARFNAFVALNDDEAVIAAVLAMSKHDLQDALLLARTALRGLLDALGPERTVALLGEVQ